MSQIVLLSAAAIVVILLRQRPDMVGDDGEIENPRPLWKALPKLLHHPQLICSRCMTPRAAEDLYIVAVRRGTWPFVCCTCLEAHNGI